jgi:hypothetical protein
MNRIDDKIDKYILLNEGAVGGWAKKIVKKALEKGKKFLLELLRDIMYSILHETLREIQGKLSAVNVSSTTSSNVKRKTKQLMREAEFHKRMFLEILQKLNDLSDENWSETDIHTIDD